MVLERCAQFWGEAFRLGAIVWGGLDPLREFAVEQFIPEMPDQRTGDGACDHGSSIQECDDVRQTRRKCGGNNKERGNQCFPHVHAFLRGERPSNSGIFEIIKDLLEIPERRNEPHCSN